MIQSRITAKSQTTIPRAVRAALGLKPGDLIRYEIEHGKVVLKKDEVGGVVPNSFLMFTEWADELDSVYDDL